MPRVPTPPRARATVLLTKFGVINVRTVGRASRPRPRPGLKKVVRGILPWAQRHQRHQRHHMAPTAPYGPKNRDFEPTVSPCLRKYRTQKRSDPTLRVESAVVAMSIHSTTVPLTIGPSGAIGLACAVSRIVPWIVRARSLPTATASFKSSEHFSRADLQQRSSTPLPRPDAGHVEASRCVEGFWL